MALLLHGTRLSVTILCCRNEQYQPRKSLFTLPNYKDPVRLVFVRVFKQSLGGIKSTKLWKNWFKHNRDICEPNRHPRPQETYFPAEVKHEASPAAASPTTKINVVRWTQLFMRRHQLKSLLTSISGRWIARRVRNSFIGKGFKPS